MFVRTMLALCCAVQLFAADSALEPLLLTPHRLRRLKRDRERQTDRWAAFEKRVAANVDSPEKALELAVYYAVTGDEQKGKEAVAQLLAKPCEELTLEIVRSATSDVQSLGEATKLEALTCQDKDHPLGRFGLDSLDVQGDEFLLSLRPEQVDQPSWQQHVAALALVNIDPNGQAAQFLQGWAIEDRFLLRDGPGVVYEFLWADPYLPGVSYQNMPPWLYREGSLTARTDWSANACWIHLGAQGKQMEHCPADFLSKPETFQNLLLKPFSGTCLEVPREDIRAMVLLSGLAPGTKLTYAEEKQKLKAQADSAGLWRVPVGVTGPVCRPKETVHLIN